MTFTYKTRGVCSRAIELDIQDNIIKHCHIVGGCRGNTEGVSRLVQGMDVDEVIRRLQGIPCQGNTSCPDQLAQALMQYKASQC